MGDSWFETDGTVTERTEAMSATRIERDSLGELPVPADALYGIQTERARQNFAISQLLPLAPFVTAVVWIKLAAALTHKQTGRLDRSSPTRSCGRRTRSWPASTAIISSWIPTRRARGRRTT